MKKINEMTEQEILNLTEEEIQKMIKLRLAEEGIKIMESPKVPKLFEIDAPDLTVYTIPCLGDNLCFLDLNEANAMLELLIKSKSLGLADYDWNKLGSDYKWFQLGKTSRYNSQSSLELKSKQVYSMELYAKITDFAVQNKKMQEFAEKEQKEYNENNDLCSDIITKIRERVIEVQEKYQRLNRFVSKYKDDYLPLSDDNQEMAIKFMAKAYSLTEEEIEYIKQNS